MMAPCVICFGQTQKVFTLIFYFVYLVTQFWQYKPKLFLEFFCLMVDSILRSINFESLK